ARLQGTVAERERPGGQCILLSAGEDARLAVCHGRDNRDQVQIDAAAFPSVAIFVSCCLVVHVAERGRAL
ncbi:hypothetical protein, partial [Mesorhizobium sp. M2D.F.Ca.ET.140.01.1.1]|uniref:hypothetical protein n=1 Tax=Mesorhizobium sp. M2D.F.Ca.ET.140.01.1.1 TaxID=2496664 RepID=UPI001AECBF92